MSAGDWGPAAAKMAPVPFRRAGHRLARCSLLLHMKQHRGQAGSWQLPHGRGWPGPLAPPAFVLFSLPMPGRLRPPWFLVVPAGGWAPAGTIAFTSIAEEAAWVALLLTAMRQQLTAAATAVKRTPYLLTIAAGAGQYYLDGVEIKAVAEQCDFINLMTYDFYNGWATCAGHHANLYRASHDPEGDSADHAVQLYLANGVRADQLVLGCPFYGRSLRGVCAAGLGAAGTAKSNGTYSYQTIVDELLPSGRYTRHWDAEAQVPWLFDGDEFISYEDPESIALKGQYAKQHGLAGVMFWEYTEDLSNTLLDALSLSVQ